MLADTGRIGTTLLVADSPSRLIGDALYDQFADEDFADRSPHNGQPALSPVIRSFVTVFPYRKAIRR